MMTSRNFESLRYRPSEFGSNGRGALVGGIVLSLMMGGFTAAFAWILLFPNAGHGVPFNGDAAAAAGVMAVFISLFVFGLAAVSTGIRQMRFHQSSVRFPRFALVALAASMAIGIFVRLTAN